MNKKTHRWQPNYYTPCGRKITDRIKTNVGYYLSEGVTCKVCMSAKTRMSILGDDWNGQSDGFQKSAK